MTRRLVASGQRPVTVGTFFSLGHSTYGLILLFATGVPIAPEEQNKKDYDF